MSKVITKAALTALLYEARTNQASLEKLRSLISGYYYAEAEYHFESPDMEDVFAVLSNYLEGEMLRDDSVRGEPLTALGRVLAGHSWTVENAITALRFKEIRTLLHKLEEGVVSQTTFEKQIRALSPLSFNWIKVVDFYKEHPEYWEVETKPN